MASVSAEFQNQNQNQNHLPYTPKKSYKAPLPTTPFNEDREDDPFMLFPEWQHPFSALRDDTQLYRQQFAEAERAEAMKMRQRGSPIDRKRLIKQCLHIGEYDFMRTPTRPKKRLSIEQKQQLAKSQELLRQQEQQHRDQACQVQHDQETQRLLAEYARALAPIKFDPLGCFIAPSPMKIDYSGYFMADWKGYEPMDLS
ncbi:hypothetical protein LTR85_009632 [Meristemomyces frigidus]|nr:hypothetical protein LTR85_009632 [Meristemomyces frigidus]